MLIKTEKGRDELRPGTRTLSQRERTMLLVADGQQRESTMAELMQGDGRRLIDQLIAQGYLERRSTGSVSQPSGSGQNTGVSGFVSHGDQFSGGRSMATARMFLFDIAERLFAPRDKAMANRYRLALREARDPQSMLEVGRALVADVEILAGSERADGISKRLARLLPHEVLNNFG